MSILLYRAETRTVAKRDRESLDVVKMDYSRRGCRVSRIEHILVLVTEIRIRMGRFEGASKKMEKDQYGTDTYGG
jgi:hypothetical protein